MKSIKHTVSEELRNVPPEDHLRRRVARLSEIEPDWDAFADSQIEGRRRAQHRFLGKWEVISCPAGVLHGVENNSAEDVYTQTFIGAGKPGPVGYADDQIYAEETQRLASRQLTHR